MVTILFVSLLAFAPSDVLASEEGIGSYYMDATVRTNGDILVKELFTVNGDYNGYDRIINYQNSQAPTFKASQSSYGGSSIHNADDIELVKIGAVDYGKDLATLTDTDIEVFSNTNNGSNYGYYNVTSRLGGYQYRIYNPSDKNKSFYLEYVVKNAAILHQDMGEIGWNIFGDELTESVANFELLFHVPNNGTLMRVWAHGPLNGNSEIIDSETVKVTIDHLSANTAFDVRLAFDPEVIRESVKKTNVVALDKVLKYEEKMADEANQIRKRERIKYYGVLALTWLWGIGMITIVLRFNLKYDKEYRSDFTSKYYREFPSNDTPPMIEYLMEKKVGTNALSATILDLVYRKVIKVEKVPGKRKDDYRFIYQPEQVISLELSPAEKILIDWLFQKSQQDTSKEESILLSEFQKNAKCNYEAFLSSYEDWKSIVETEAEQRNFFHNFTHKKTWAVFYALLGIVLVFVLANLDVNMIVIFAILVLAIGSIIYLLSFQKRTVEGNELYVRWKAFKNFLLDFGNFSQKELPEIVLWEKYLVYAVVLGCAGKLAKTMEIKAQEYYPAGSNLPIDSSYDFYFMVSFNRAISRGMDRAVSNAISTRSAAQSANSSGGGFGGGFSSGGGSFGGGGGGGRF